MAEFDNSKIQSNQIKQALFESSYLTRISYLRAFLLTFSLPIAFVLFRWYELRLEESSIDPNTVAAICRFTVTDEQGRQYQHSIPTTPSSINRTIWDRLAPNFDGHVNRVERIFGVTRRRAELMKLARGRVLEVGGGTCRNLRFLLENPRVTHYTTIDFSASMLEASVQNITKAVEDYKQSMLAADSRSSKDSQLLLPNHGQPISSLPPAPHGRGMVSLPPSAVPAASRLATIIARRQAEAAARDPLHHSPFPNTDSMRVPRPNPAASIPHTPDSGGSWYPFSSFFKAFREQSPILRLFRPAAHSPGASQSETPSDTVTSPSAELSESSLVSGRDLSSSFTRGLMRWAQFYRERFSLSTPRQRCLAPEDVARGIMLAALAEWPAAPFPIKVELGNVTDLRQFQDNEFDTVIDTFGLCSFDDPFKAIEEMLRVVKKPGGRILLLEHGRSDWSDFINSVFLDKRAVRHAQDWGCWWNRDIPLICRVGGLKIVYHESFGLGTFHLIVGRPYRDGEKRDPDILSYFKFIKPNAPAVLRADHPVAPLMPTRYPDELAKEAARKRLESMKQKASVPASEPESDDW